MTREEEIKKLKARIEQLESQCNWTPQKGELCKVWDDEDDLHLKRFSHFDDDGYFVDENYYCWDRFEPFSLPATVWKGGECPVPEDQLVAYEFRNGKRHVAQGGSIIWWHNDRYDDIIKFWRLAP